MENLETMIQKGQKPYYRPDLERLLNNLGVTAGDTLILHTSLKSFGYLIGGAAMLIDTVLNCIGPEGTLVMPSQSVNNMNPKFWQYPPVPQDWHDDIRETMLPYDPQRTPVDDLSLSKCTSKRTSIIFVLCLWQECRKNCGKSPSGLWTGYRVTTAKIIRCRC